MATQRHTCAASLGSTEGEPRSSIRGERRSVKNERRSSWDIAKEALASGSLVSKDLKLMETPDRSLTKEERRKKRRDSLTSGDEMWGRHGSEPKSRPERDTSRRPHSSDCRTACADSPCSLDASKERPGREVSKQRTAALASRGAAEGVRGSLSPRRAPRRDEEASTSTGCSSATPAVAAGAA